METASITASITAIIQKKVRELELNNKLKKLLLEDGPHNWINWVLKDLNWLQSLVIKVMSRSFTEVLSNEVLHTFLFSTYL